MQVRIIHSGRGYDRTAALPDELTLSDGATVDDALAELQKLAGDDGVLSAQTLVALSGQHLGTVAAHRAVPLRDGDELSFIAPVAGG